MNHINKNATIKDIAKIANTSHATVSRVINGTDYPVSEKLRTRILKVAEELNYTPNLIGKSLKTGILKDIGVMIPNIVNPYYSNLILGLEDVLGNQGYNLLMCNSHRNPQKEETILRNFMMKQVSGIIISPVSKNYQILEQINRKNIKIIVMEQDMEGFPCSTIVYDYIKSGFIATEHLIKLEHRKIAYISAPMDRFSRSKIFEGYKHALKEYDIEFDEQLVEIAQSEKEQVNEIYEFNNGYNLTKKLLNKINKPTAIFACNDMTAIGAIEAIKECGLAIPDEISVVGCDNILSCLFISPKLTTIDEPSYEMSKIIGNLMLEKLKGNYKDTNIVIQPSLVIRKSTAKHLKLK